MIARDRHGCERMGARTVALAEKFDLPFFRWWGRYIMGWAKVQGPTLSEGLALIEEAFSRMVNVGHYKFFGAGLAEALFDAGRVTDALALVDHAVNTGQGPASGQYVAEIHRLRGVFLRSLGSPAEEVESALRTALRIAEEQGAFLLKLRAATSLARLWHDQGRSAEGYGLLAPIYERFTEGFETADLKVAKALIDQLQTHTEDRAGRSEIADEAAAASRGPPISLPEPVSELVGREAELSEVADLVRTHRLVTLVGEGGVGKTRLGVEIGRAHV